MRAHTPIFPSASPLCWGCGAVGTRAQVWWGQQETTKSMKHGDVRNWFPSWENGANLPLRTTVRMKETGPVRALCELRALCARCQKPSGACKTPWRKTHWRYGFPRKPTHGYKQTSGESTKVLILKVWSVVSSPGITRELVSNAELGCQPRTESKATDSNCILTNPPQSSNQKQQEIHWSCAQVRACLCPPLLPYHPLWLLGQFGCLQVKFGVLVWICSRGEAMSLTYASLTPLARLYSHCWAGKSL